MLCEGYGPGGTVLLIACLSGAPARTRVRLGEILACHGAALGAPGSVAYLFAPAGVLWFRSPVTGLAEAAYAAGAECVRRSADGSVEVFTDPRELHGVRAALATRGFRSESTAVTQRAALEQVVAGEEASNLRELVAALRACPEVRAVHTNASIESAALGETGA
jgi:transcriptional/translational regulatory protein YebC/TACO1